jgi:hypothetical protein
VSFTGSNCCGTIDTYLTLILSLFVVGVNDHGRSFHCTPKLSPIPLI